MSELVPLKSEQGEHLLKEILSETSDDRKYIQPNLIWNHYKQQTDSTCGVAACVMIFNSRLNSLGMTALNEYRLLMHPRLIRATNNKIGDIFKNGLTVNEVSKIWDAFECDHSVSICKEKDDEDGMNRFRAICKEVFQAHDGSKGIIVNYFMRDIGQPSKTFTMPWRPWIMMQTNTEDTS